jgi:hypothetical protein
MDKFGRNYRLTVDTIDGGSVVIEPPFTVQFDIQRNVLSSANVINVQVLNLSQRVRDQIRKDEYDYGVNLLMKLEAGYGQDLSTVATGNLRRCFTVRQGTEIVTSIDAFDGGFAFSNGLTSRTYQSGTPNNVILKDLAGTLREQGVSLGAIGQVDGEIPRGNSYTGNASELLNELSGNKFFIDNQQVFILRENEVLDLPVPVLTAKSGLLGTPVREKSNLILEVLFEPNIRVAQKVQVISQTADNYSGFYKVVAVHHSGIISGAVSGKATTKLNLFYGSESLRTVELLS